MGTRQKARPGIVAVLRDKKMMRKLREGSWDITARHIPNDAAKEAADNFIAPVIEGLGEHYGARTRLAELLSARAGKPISRNRLTRWLKDDTTKREMPSLGHGLLLREVFDANRGEICQRHNPWNKRPDGGKKLSPSEKPKPKRKRQ